SFILAVFVAPHVPVAQQASKVWRIAYFSPIDSRNANDDAFDAAMKQLGYVEGQNLAIERRFTSDQRPEAQDEVIRELVRSNPDVIVVWAGGPALAAQRATNTVRIVFIGSRAAVERGIVPSLARPGGNITGTSTYAVETIDPKLFELAKELLPRLSLVAALRGIDPPGAIATQENTARSLGFKLAPIPFKNDEDASHVSVAVEHSRAQALIAPDTPLLLVRRKEIVQLAAKQRLPVVYAFREAVEDGGLIALYTDLKNLAQRSAGYVDKIFKGSKPGDLPVEQPTKMDLVINLKTAKTLGLTIPPSLLLRADQIIQ